MNRSSWYTSKPKGEHRVFIMSEGQRIATVAHNSGRQNANANAMLMAAAPALYEALEYLLAVTTDSKQGTLARGKAVSALEAASTTIG